MSQIPPPPTPDEAETKGFARIHVSMLHESVYDAGHLKALALFPPPGARTLEALLKS